MARRACVVDVTRYDPLAYGAPQHTVGVFTRATEYQVPIFNECVSNGAKNASNGSDWKAAN